MINRRSIREETVITFKEKIIVTVIGVLVISFVIWLSGVPGLLINGISHLSNNEDKYHNMAHQVEGEFVVEIDLSDLESNEGKILYDDKTQIYISHLNVENDSNYEVIFRSSGNYNTSGASLVSGIEHATFNNEPSKIFQAEAKATYGGETFVLSPATSTDLVYRDGDKFGFYLFPEGEEVEIDLDTDPIIEVEVTNLYRNLWVKKP
ncbi:MULTISPECIES: hypothetical protein [Bacillaceae]|uniref:DUF4352 domain-containing protein n=1 Tax=Evansella alkalicola TaxID=745819 RepID=A0ABS6JR19_9BACI|nr:MULTISPECIES: hypothetical protein [Bacillaceae]MBU9720865.1 hypothetical protein [Bacillus alkalicola]